MRLSSIQNDTLWFLKGGGEMGNLIQQYGWKATQFQDPIEWVETLKSALSLTLNSKIPTVLFWGQDLIGFIMMHASRS